MTSLPAISDFLKDTLGESLKKPLQPSSLFVGAIFVFLNLFFIFPLLQDSVPIIQSFSQLDTGWQLVLALVATLIIAYLVLSISSSVLRLLSGELWSNSPVLGRFFLWCQKRRLSQREKAIQDYQEAIDDLNDEIATLKNPEEKPSDLPTSDAPNQMANDKLASKIADQGDTKEKRSDPQSSEAVDQKDGEEARDRMADQTDGKEKPSDPQINDSADKDIQQKTAQCKDLETTLLQLRWERETNFPAEASYLAPTALGNILNATSSRVWQRYHIDMAALWSHLETIIADKTAIAARIDNSKATLDFFLNLAAVLVLFGTEYLIVGLTQHQGRAGLAALIFWLLAYLLYRVAWGRARTWGDTVQMAFDLYRDDLRKALGLRSFINQNDELDVWEKASGWLLWGDRAPEIFASEPKTTTPALTLNSSDNVHVKCEKRVCDADERRPPQEATQHVELISHMDYWLLVTNSIAGSGDQVTPAADGVFVTICDPGVPQIAAPPTGVLLGVNPEAITARLMPADRTNPYCQLLWHIGQVPAHGTRVLYYSLPIPTDTVQLTTNNKDLVITEKIMPSSGQVAYDYELKVKNLGASLDATLEVNDGRIVLPADPPIGTVEICNESGLLLRHRSLRPDQFAAPDRYAWQLGKLNANETATLTYQI